MTLLSSGDREEGLVEGKTEQEGSRNLVETKGEMQGPAKERKDQQKPALLNRHKESLTKKRGGERVTAYAGRGIVSIEDRGRILRHQALTKTRNYCEGRNDVGTEKVGATGHVLEGGENATKWRSYSRKKSL